LVVSRSDTQVVATVGSSAVSGIARIQQNGVWSSALGFTVPVPNGFGKFNTLVPALLNMAVGDTRTLQALGTDSGQTVTGLTWATTDPTVVSLSPDDPPVLTALAAGHVTITAGSGSSDVTVSVGPLPIGTVIWSNPGDGSGVSWIVPAVPSPTGVADVFAFQNDGTVQAITSDGTVAWTADVSQANYQAPGSILPDFQGGLVVVGGSGIYKLDGITGQPYPAYQGGLAGSVAVHPDGTIFAMANDFETYGYAVVGIDPTTGGEKFRVPLPTSVESDQGITCGNIIVAGDGNAYMGCGWFIYDAPDPYGTPNTPFILRASSDGAYTFIESGLLDGDTVMESSPTMISDADQGVIMAWGDYLVGVHGMNVSVVSRPQVLGGEQPFPVLQAQDGSFVGSTCGPFCFADYGVYGDMVSFDASGNVRWVVPNDYPQIATADGGVIGQSGITYDQDGRATGMVPTPTYSWTGNSYQIGSVE
jgi:hypothetical protein